MHKPNYLALLPGGHIYECDMLATAIEKAHKDANGMVYERLGHHVSVKLGHEDAMLAALKRIVEAPDGCPFCDSGKLRTPDDPEKGHIARCGFYMAEQVIGKVETYNAEVAQALAENEM